MAIYSFMFGPAMKQACPMCTSFIDSLNGAAPHFEQRANLAVVAKSPTERIRGGYAQGRGWNQLRLLSSARNSYNRDYHGENAEGGQIPSLKGQNQRHIDMMWPLWNLLDMTPEGRGANWFPKIGYL